MLVFFFCYIVLFNRNKVKYLKKFNLLLIKVIYNFGFLLNNIR